MAIDSYSPTLRSVPPAVVACSWTTFAVGTLLLLIAVTTAQAQTPAPATDTPDVSRVLEAEILELAEGDLDAAMKIYREVAASDAAEPSLAARALFALGRCHRKKGELGAARDRFREVVERFPGQSRIADLARRFAAEIDAGRSEIPEFDWLEQVGANAEIQARIFDLGMKLVNESESPTTTGVEAKLAKKQLRALGVITVPILEPMLENSRDPQHRVALAEILVSLGRIERLSELFPLPVGVDLPHQFTTEFLGHLRLLPAERQRAAVALLEAIDLPNENIDRAVLARLRLGLGGFSKLEEDLPFVGLNWWLVERALLGERESAVRVAQFLASEAQTTQVSESRAAFRVTIARSLLEHRPELLTQAQLAAIRDLDLIPDARAVGRNSRYSAELANLSSALIAASRIDDVGYLVEGSRSKVVMVSLCEYPEATVWREQGSIIDVPTQAKILRSAGAYDLLFRLALERDDAIAELESLLLEEDRTGAEWQPTRFVYQAKNWGEHVRSYWKEATLLSGRTGFAPELQVPEISEAFCESMLRVVRRARGARVQAIALDALRRAAPVSDAKYAQAMLEILRSGRSNPSEQDGWITLLAAAGTLSHGVEHREIANAAIPLIESMLDQSEETLRQLATSAFVVGSESNPDPANPNSDWDGPSWIAIEFLRTGRKLNGKSLHQAASSIAQMITRLCADGDPDRKHLMDVRMLAIFEILLPSFVRGEGAKLMNGFLESNSSTFGRDRLAEVFPNVKGTEGKVVALEMLFDRPRSFDLLDTFPVESLSQAIENPEIKPWLRRTIIENLARTNPRSNQARSGRQQNRSPEEKRERFESATRVLDAVDWASVIEKEPEFVASFARWTDVAALHRHAWTLIQSTEPDLREIGYRNLPDDSEHLDAAFERGLAETNPDVKRAALAELFRLGTTAALPWLYRLLETGDRRAQLTAMDRLAFLADPRSLPKLTPYLTHEDFSLRAKALESLQAIEHKLEEQKKWLERYGGSNSGKKAEGAPK